MTDNLPEPYEGEYIEGEIVEGNIWESCNRHHMRHCLACFPHQPWRKHVDPVEEIIRSAQTQALNDLYDLQQQLFEQMFGSVEHTENMANLVAEHDRWMQCRAQRRWVTFWSILAPFYALLGMVDFMSDNEIGGYVFAFLSCFAVFMRWWNRRHLRELQRGRS